jgi:C1A family cysteine protease
MSEIIVIDGQEFGTGLLLPAFKPRTFPTYGDNGPMFMRDQIAKIVTDPGRVAGSRLWKPEEWIRSQGNVGSCNGQAAAHALERTQVSRGIRRRRLSGEGLYALINGGRDQGSMLDDGMHALKNNGVPEEQYVPLAKFLTQRQLSREAVDSMRRNRAHECYRVETEDELASGLAAGFCGVVAVHATQSYGRLDGRGVSPPASGPGNHAVLVHDIRISPAGSYEFESANSWGLKWGNKGHNWITWASHLQSTIRYHAFYLIRSTTFDKGDTPGAIE